MGAKIGFECVAPDHRTGQGGPETVDKLTVVNGEWAYCAFSSRAADHKWKSTGGEEYPALMRRTSHSVARASHHEGVRT